MSNEEKAKLIAKLYLDAPGDSLTPEDILMSKALELGAKLMGEWKDQQFKEYILRQIQEDPDTSYNLRKSILYEIYHNFYTYNN